MARCFAIQRNIPLVPFKRIHARNIPQNAVVAYHMRGCDVVSPVDCEQHFFLHSGDDIKTVQENLGHHTAAFTLDQYGHVTETMRRDSADRMQAFIKAIPNA